eukprot:TRINITY_DN590_c0_g1_i13.p1 TRINITY_DN590_c0_g1~~TRINITY_DN590_c0_g1_i13.p1  ORF type:complete len:132 (+),score=6.64 TRINITY_DN590_c0_g1_i13:484-879(+)
MATQTDRCSVFATEFNRCQLSFRELLMAAYPGCSPDDIDRYIGKYGCQKHCEKGHVVGVSWLRLFTWTASGPNEEAHRGGARGARGDPSCVRQQRGELSAWVHSEVIGWGDRAQGIRDVLQQCWDRRRDNR